MHLNEHSIIKSPSDAVKIVEQNPHLIQGKHQVIAVPVWELMNMGLSIISSRCRIQRGHRESAVSFIQIP